LNASQVKQVVHARPDELEYEKLRPTYADTADGQWELAQWCADHGLTAQRETHLRRVIELDPDHAEARRILGYHQENGQWVTKSDVMAQRGYKRYKGEWKTQQEIDLLEKKHKQDVGQQEWFKKLRLWRGWLGTDRSAQARENIIAITDAAAIKALENGLRDSSTQVRLLYIEALAKIDTLEAAKILANVSINDEDEEVRHACLDALQAKPRPEIVTFYVGKLGEKKNYQIIDLAAVALGRLKDPAAIGPLIHALVTTHRVKIPKPGGDNAMNNTFSKGPGGGGMNFGVGGGPKFEERHVQHKDVLDALIAMTGKDFGFDVGAWNDWYASQKKVETLDPRRN
jgi:hypothetical protein